MDPDGEYVVTGAQDETLQRWDLFTGSQTVLKGHRSWVRRFDIHPDGDLMVSGDYAGRLVWWDPLSPSPEPLRTIDAHKGYVRGVSISPDRRFVATGGNDNMVRIWSAEDGSLVHEMAGHERHVYNVRFHPDGRHLVSGDLMGVLKVWETDTGEHVRDLDAGPLTGYDKTFRADCGGIRGIDFSPDGTQLVVCGIGEVTNAFAGVGTPTALLFDWESGERLQTMKPQDNFRGTCWSVRFHPSGEFIVGSGGSNAGSLWFWKPGEEKAFFAFKLPQVGYDLAFHPDGLRLAVALYNQTVCLYDLGPKIEVAEGGP
jgi:WD40 repeat protein